MSAGAKPAVERAFAAMRETLAYRRFERHAAGRPWTRPSPLVADRIATDREVFLGCGDRMQVSERIPSDRGRDRDILLVRCWSPPHWAPRPFIRAFQVRDLERMIADGRVTLLPGGDTAGTPATN